MPAITYSGICPEALEALDEANHGHAPSYGDDGWTQGTSDALREVFETDCDVFFVFNGTRPEDVEALVAAIRTGLPASSTQEC